MDNLLSKSLYGVVYLMGLNFLTHGLTFVLNTLIVRMVQTNVFGLLVSTILFLSREAFRNACQRSAEGDVGDKRWQREWERKLTNLSWAVVPLGVAVTLATFALSVLTASPEERALDNYHLV
ncbi:protein rft1 family protein, partial [Acanthamoeba castellanii str. Neff]